jgi:hypothetical protein
MVDISPIVIGETREKEVRKLYGDPLRVTEKFDHRCLTYKVTEITEAAVCVDKDHIVILLSHPVDSDEVTIPDDYEDPLVFYSHYGHGAQTLAFPEKGITFVVSSTGKVVWLIHHREMDRDTYAHTVGGQFPQENPFVDA